MGRLADLSSLQRRTAAFALATLLLSTSRWAAAAFEPDDRGWEGTSEFIALARGELGQNRVRVITSLDYSRLDPADAIVFFHPEVDIRFQPLAAFLAAGGRAAVIDDVGTAASLLERFHIHRANAPTLPALRLRDNSNLPIALPAPSESSAAETSDHPTLRGVDQVVTNHPTALRLEPGIELTRLLLLPARGEPDALLAVTGVIGDARACGLASGAVSRDTPTGHCGRLLAMGDPSAFINLMLRYPGNRKFARGLVTYLLEDDTWGRRGGNLYVLTGSFRQSGSYGESAGLRETLSEQQAALIDWIKDVQKNGLPEPVTIALAAILVIAVAIWAGFAGGQLYVPALPGYARGIPAVAQGGFAGRFAVLSAPSSDRALVMLELDRSLRARLEHRFGLPPGSSHGALLEAAARRGFLEPDRVRALGALLTRLSAGKVALTNARRLSVSDPTLDALHQRVLDILAEMNDQEEAQRDSSSQHR